ncbi:glycine N-acyltransferase-like protein 3 isoform X2 [Toxotes jaculatrix]|uniref:glycine N-acyltransferase-like protein 3 isoform X2 n=2 Tax=Toxotes jaculatrix TaxID=941984 RepID=UPI001B3AFF76|nr:glycine N-acyltransferase-like protein 3 isoform X2 [Toxotes jaculatrix]
MELSGEQLKIAEARLKRYLPRSQQKQSQVRPCDGFSGQMARVQCHCLQTRIRRGDLFKDVLIFANNEALLEETIRKSSVIDWTRPLCLGINLQHMEVFKAVASEKNVPSNKLAVCHMMILEDVSKLPSIDSSGISLSSLDESHIGLVNQTWKFGKDEMALRMIRNMTVHFPSCCVLDAERKPVSWILTYASCAMGMLYTLPEHRGKGYAKVLVSTLAKRLHAQEYPVYCFVEEENVVSHRLFKNLGFTEDPSYRETWFTFNDM